VYSRYLSNLNSGNSIGPLDLIFFQIGTKHPVLKYIFARHAFKKMEKRHNMKWIPGNHEGSHNDCDCDLEVSFPALNIPSIRQERYRGRRRDISEMYAEAKAIVVANYYLAPKKDSQELEVCKMPQNNELYLGYLREYYTPTSQIAVEAPFPVSNSVIPLLDPVNQKWRYLHEDCERRYWAKVCPRVNEIDKTEERGGLPTLRALCAKKVSWVDTVYGKWFGQKRVVHSKENMNVQKALRLYADFCVETTRRSPEDISVFKYVPEALNNLLLHMGCYENFGVLNFEYNPKDLIRKVRLFTSGGIMPGGTRQVSWKGVKCEVMSQGQKCQLLEAAMRKLHAVLHKIKTDDQVMCEIIHCIIKAKDEYRYGQFKSVEELKSMAMKIREFFIPDLPHIYMCMLVNEKRMLLERNNVIRIGMTYWWGGSYFLFKYLNGDQEDFIWVDGDIEGLDKHISDWLLLLYCANVYPYYNWDVMGDTEKRFVRRLLEYWATNVCAKLVCHRWFLALYGGSDVFRWKRNFSW